MSKTKTVPMTDQEYLASKGVVDSDEVEVEDTPSLASRCTRCDELDDVGTRNVHGVCWLCRNREEDV